MSESPMPGSSAGLDTWPGGGLRTVSPCSHADHTVDSVNRELCSIFSDISKKITPLRKIGRKKKKKKKEGRIWGRVLLKQQELSAIVRGKPML